MEGGVYRRGEKHEWAWKDGIDVEGEAWAGVDRRGQAWSKAWMGVKAGSRLNELMARNQSHEVRERSRKKHDSPHARWEQFFSQAHGERLIIARRI